MLVCKYFGIVMCVWVGTFCTSDNRHLVANQNVRYILNVLTRIRKAGYPIRHTYKEFMDRYYMLGTGAPPSAHGFDALKNRAETITKAVLGKGDWQMGKTKIFLKVRNKNSVV